MAGNCPESQHVVAPGRGHLESPPRMRLPADVGEVAGGERGDGEERLAVDGRRATRRFTADVGDGFGDARRAAVAIDRAPRTAWTRPSSPSSPRTHQPSSAGSDVLPSAARMPRAIGRSNAAPSLRTPAGARFTVTRFVGYSKPALRSAARMRSLA